MTYAAENIAAEIVTRLEEITTANSYPLDVASVDRLNRLSEGFTPKPNSIVVEQENEVRNESHDRPGNPPAMAYEQTYLINGFIRQSDDSELPDATFESRMESAIKKAIAESSHTWHQFDGNSYDANWGETTPYESTDHAGITVRLVVRYRVSELDPDTLRN